MSSESPEEFTAASYLPQRIKARLNKRTRKSCCHPLVEKAQSRRAVILESKKSLLRARAAHVEQVREQLRLKDIQAHKNGSQRLTALKISLDSAQKARDAILAKTATHCAQEVAKAKQIAKEMKRKRSEEAQSALDEMNERLAEAEKRRLEIQKARAAGRRHRGSTSSTSGDEGAGSKAEARRALTETKRREEAATIIQRNWRIYKNRKIVQDFVDLGISIESSKAIPFEQVSVLFQEERVRNATIKLLDLCGLLQHEDNQFVNIEQCCRTFLSSFLVLSHPSEVFSNGGKDETDLITLSKDLLCAFEAWVASTSRANFFTGSFSNRKSLHSCWTKFSAAFSTWKERDSNSMLKIMIAQYVELDLIWQKVKEDTEEHAAAEFKQGIQQNQLELLAAIRKLVGSKTRELVGRAVRKARKERLPVKKNMTPRNATEQTHVNPKEAPAGPTTGEKTSTSPAEISVVKPEPAPTPAPAPAPAPVVAAGTEGFPSNRKIVHEMALDGEFRLKEHKPSGLEAMIAETMKRAFFDKMKEDIENGDLVAWVPQMATTVKEKLLKLVDPKSAFHKLIQEALDIELIESQCRAGVYDHEKFFAFILWLLPKLCSPARDDEVKALGTDDLSFYDRLRRLLDLLEAMQLDYANYLLMASVRAIVPQAIPYERKHFTDDLQAGRITLTVTRRWLESSAKEVLAESSRRTSPNASGKHGLPSMLSIYNNAYIDLAFAFDPLDPKEIPETFHLDHERLHGIRETVRTLSLSSAILTTVKSLMRRDARTPWTSLKEKINALLAKHSPSDDSSTFATDLCQFIQETNAIPPATQQHIASAVTRILRTLTAPSGQLDAVVRVVFNRLKQFTRARLEAVSQKDRVQLATEAPNALASLGLVEQVDDVARLVEKIDRLGQLNRATYEEWYNEIIKEAIETAGKENRNETGGPDGN